MLFLTLNAMKNYWSACTDIQLTGPWYMYILSQVDPDDLWCKNVINFSKKKFKYHNLWNRYGFTYCAFFKLSNITGVVKDHVIWCELE